jgi:DNA (cytosine-5)-methyltransferase 1
VVNRRHETTAVQKEVRAVISAPARMRRRPTHVDTHSFRVLSLCAGIGGIDLGLSLALPAARTVCYVENEATACEKLVARIEDGALDDAPVWTDLRTFNGRKWRGLVHCVSGGYPCQPFSCAGKQRGAKDPRHLWPHVARIIREVQPEWVFLENVANHLRIGFREVARELRAMGYRVEAGLFSATEVGAPHLRKRLFVLAHWGSVAHTEYAGSSQRRTKTRSQAEADQLGGSRCSVADTASQRRKESSGAERQEFAAESRSGMDNGPKRRRLTVADTEQPRRNGSAGQGLRTNGLSL